MQVQGRHPRNVPSALHQRLASLQAFFGYCTRLSSARRTGAVDGIRWAYRQLAWAERQRRRRQTEFDRRGREAIEWSRAAGDGIAADVDVEWFRAKGAAARERSWRK